MRRRPRRWVGVVGALVAAVPGLAGGAAWVGAVPPSDTVDPAIPTTAPGPNPYVIPPPSDGAIVPGGEPTTGTAPEVIPGDSGLPPLVPGRARGTWHRTGSLSTPRMLPVVAELADGRVLVAGGGTEHGATASAEVYDPVTGRWSATGSMHAARLAAASVVLADGRVLVAGGAGSGPHHRALRTAELYDPETGDWTVTGPLHVARRGTTAVAVAHGALVAGGADASGRAVASVEIYDADAGTWKSGPPLHAARSESAIAPLPGGGVLVAGGVGPRGFTATAERWSPGAAAWRAVKHLPEPRAFDTATPLADGRVLVAGTGVHGVVFDPTSGTWSQTGGMASVHAQGAAVRLADGRVLLAGGTSGHGADPVSEVYDPAANAWQRGPDLVAAVGATGVARLANGAVLMPGGANGPDPTSVAQVYGVPGQRAPFLRPSGRRSGSSTGTAGDRHAGSGSNAGRLLIGGAVALVVVLLIGAFVTRSRRPATNGPEGRNG